MANQASKKNQKDKEFYMQYYNAGFALLNLGYLLSLIYSYLYSEDISLIWEVVWFAIYIGLEFKLMTIIGTEIGNGDKNGWSLDCFGVLTLS